MSSGLGLTGDLHSAPNLNNCFELLAELMDGSAVIHPAWIARVQWGLARAVRLVRSGVAPSGAQRCPAAWTLLKGFSPPFCGSPLQKGSSRLSLCAYISAICCSRHDRALHHSHTWTAAYYSYRNVFTALTCTFTNNLHATRIFTKIPS